MLKLLSSRLQGLFVVILLSCSFVARGADGPAATTPAATERKPAQMMTFEGANWLERPSRVEEEHPDDVIKTMKLHDGDVVADLGCGTGFYSRRIAKVIAPTGKVYAEEIQPEYLKMIDEHCKKDGVTNVIPVLGTEDDPKIPDASADWVILVDVYHEFQKPQNMLAKISKCLKPDGKVALVEFRLEGDTSKDIKVEHRMSVEQVLAEWDPAGFELAERLENLPKQHLFIFRKVKSPKTPDSK